MLIEQSGPDVAETRTNSCLWRHRPRSPNWADFDRIVASLKDLNEDETLLVQSGKPSGLPHAQGSPRVLIANSQSRAALGEWDHFNELDKKVSPCTARMTAGSWILYRYARHRAGHL